MSWSEVKKINSNLNKPLDELITEESNNHEFLSENSNGIYYKKEGYGGATKVLSNVTLLDVEGNISLSMLQLILSVSCGDKTTVNKATFSVYVDDEKIIELDLSGVGTAGSSSATHHTLQIDLMNVNRANWLNANSMVLYSTIDNQIKYYSHNIQETNSDGNISYDYEYKTLPYVDKINYKNMNAAPVHREYHKRFYMSEDIKCKKLKIAISGCNISSDNLGNHIGATVSANYSLS